MVFCTSIFQPLFALVYGSLVCTTVNNWIESCRFCDHPGEDFLKKAVIVFADLADSIYSEAIESVLYSFATFSFHPGYQLLEKFSSRVLENPTVFSPLHLANILWCFALFEFCDNDLWTVVVKEFSRLMESSDVGMPPMALYRIYQVCTTSKLLVMTIVF